MSKNIKDIIHSKREATEDHIRQLEKDGAQTVRYTATMPDIKFFILGMLCDAGWIIHLAAKIAYYSQNGITSIIDFLAFAALACVITGVGFTVYMNVIHEKEIATKFQKNMSFGLTCFGGLFGAIIAVMQMALFTGFYVPLLLTVIGGMLNFATGLPIFLSFKQGIIYGVH